MNILEGREIGLESYPNIKRYVDTFSTYFGTGDRMDLPLPGFTGRILRGVEERDFETFTDNPQRKVIFLLDSLGLCGLVGLDGRQILQHIGYDEGYIDKLLLRQTKFKLAIIPEMSVKVVTWDNLLDAVGEAYPEWRQKIEEVRPNLKTDSYDRIKAGRGVCLEVRTFLEETINVNRLYTGDGYTRTENNLSRAVLAEYVSLNRTLSSFETHALIDFPVR